MPSLNFDYDQENDILYISVNNPKPSYTQEDLPGIIIRKDFETDDITGITILDFARRLNDKSLPISSIPLDVDLSQIQIQ